ncbi:hypothetical protein PMSD_23040 [Paenibacillus macquariensis subsp. defensor]|nr:hypothetical protein PMSD_23040 [Paenibacillus macquariensis subsp. defensor]
MKLTEAQINEIELALLDRIKDLKGRIISFDKPSDEKFAKSTELRLINAKEALEVIRRKGE